MKKITITLIVLIAVAITTNAQIPNSGFENWTTVGNCMKPTDWDNTNDFADTTGSYFGVTRSTDHYPASVGSYSIRLENKPSLLPSFAAAGFAGTGFDGPAFPIVGHPTSLHGYYKFLPQNNDTMRIFIAFYKNGSDIFSEKIEDTVTVSAWTSFTIPFPSYTDADSARIFISSLDPDAMNPQGNSVLYIDNLSFDTLITSVSEPIFKNILFNLYPNPASDIVTININNTNHENLTIDIYNITGVLVKSEILKQSQRQINIGYLSNGIYMLTIKSKSVTENQKLIILK